MPSRISTAIDTRTRRSSKGGLHSLDYSCNPVAAFPDRRRGRRIASRGYAPEGMLKEGEAMPRPYEVVTSLTCGAAPHLAGVSTPKVVEHRSAAVAVPIAGHEADGLARGPAETGRRHSGESNS